MERPSNLGVRGRSDFDDSRVESIVRSSKKQLHRIVLRAAGLGEKVVLRLCSQWSWMYRNTRLPRIRSAQCSPPKLPSYAQITVCLCQWVGHFFRQRLTASLVALAGTFTHFRAQSKADELSRSSPACGSERHIRKTKTDLQERETR